MFEQESLHYFNIGSYHKVHWDRRRCIERNIKRDKLKWELWYCMFLWINFSIHREKDLLNYLENKKGIKYYFHTFDWKEDIVNCFINYNEFKDVVDKDLELYDKSKSTETITEDEDDFVSVEDYRRQFETSENHTPTSPPTNRTSGRGTWIRWQVWVVWWERNQPYWVASSVNWEHVAQQMIQEIQTTQLEPTNELPPTIHQNVDEHM